MGYPQAPCKDCDQHSMRCHSTCAKYTAFLIIVDGYKKTVQENRKKTYMAESISVARSDRANKILRRVKKMRRMD